MPSLVSRDVLGPGLREWAIDVLQPLADEGRIRLLDATNLFAGDATECADFFDFYHQNAAGRARLDAWLQPQVERYLYAPANASAPSGR